MQSRELTRALEAIRDRARRAVTSLDDGRSVNGRTALEAIVHEADDALRHHGEDRELAGVGRFDHPTPA